MRRDRPVPSVARFRLNSYRVRFIAAMTSVVVLGFVAMVLTNRYFGERTNRSHAEALAEQGLQRMVSQLQVITTDAVNQSAVLERVVRAQAGAFDPVAALCDVAPLFMASDSITYAGVAIAETGEYAFLQRRADGAVLLRHYAIGANEERFVRDGLLEPDGALSAVQVSPWDGYDPRERPFYLAVANEGRRIWTDSYLFPANQFTPASAGVTLASPVRDEEGKLQAVVDVDFGTIELSRFVRQLQQGVVGRVFVMEQREDGARRVVVHSDYLEAGAVWGANLGFDPLVAESSRRFEGDFEVLAANPPPPQMIDLDGEEFLSSIRFLGGEMQPRWMVVSVLPMAVVSAEMHKLQRAAIGMLTLIAVAGIGFSWFLAVGLSRPIARLGAEVERVAEGKAMRDEARRRGPVEITQLANQFHVMAEKVADREKTLVANEASTRANAQRLLRANDITHDVALTLAQSGLADGIQQVLESSLELLQAWRVSVWRVCNEAGDIELVSLKSIDGPVDCGRLRIPRADHAAYWQSMERDGKVLVADARTDSRTARIYAERMKHEGHISFLDLGVVVGGRISGLFSVHRRDGEAWRAEDELLARAMTDLLAFAFEREARRVAEQQLEAQANRLVRNSELIAALTRELYRSESIQDGLRHASQFCGEALEVAYVVTWLALEKRELHDFVSVFDVASGGHRDGGPLPLAVDKLLKRELREERCLVIPDSAADPAMREYFSKHLPGLPMLNLLISPLMAREQIVGFVCAQSAEQSRRWTAEDKLFLGAVADVLSLRMESLARRQAEEFLRRRSERISVLNTALSRVAADPVVHGDRAEDALRKLTLICLDGLRVGRVSIWIRHPEPERLEMHHRQGLRDDFTDQHYSFAQTAIPLLFTALEKNRHVEINLTSDEPIAAQFNPACFARDQVVSVLCTPVRLRGELKGMLCVESLRHRRTWTEEEKIFNGAISDMVASVFESEARRIAEMENEESRERIRMLIERTPLAAIDWDRGMRVRGWNPAAERIFGVPAQEALGHKAWFMVDPAEREAVVRGWRQVLREQGSYVPRVRNRRKDGSVVICDWHNSLLTDASGRAIGISSLVEDVTERVRVEEEVRELNASLEQRVEDRTAELQRANERLEELDRLKSEFIATMSHELRTPLNSIIGFSKILKQGLAGPLNDEQLNQIGRVHASGVHLLGLINDLLDLSKIEAGRMRLAIERFNPAKLVHDLQQLLVPMVAVKDLEFVVKNEVPEVEIVSDPTRVYQILVNLATNAVKFTRKGNVTVRVHAVDDRLHFEVSDTGMGIEADKIGQLFEAFRQVDGSARRDFEGTGLGLYLSRKIVTMLGGNIGVESVYGEGSRFTFWLPLNAALPSADSQSPFTSVRS